APAHTGGDTSRARCEQSHLVMRVELGSFERLIELVDRARRLFDLDADPHEITTHLRRSSLLAALIDRHSAVRVPGAWEPFEVAVRAILGQEITVRGATALAGRLVSRYGARIETSDERLSHLFPSPEALAEADVEQIGMPRARATAIRAMARAVA